MQGFIEQATNRSLSSAKSNFYFQLAFGGKKTATVEAERADTKRFTCDAATRLKWAAQHLRMELSLIGAALETRVTDLFFSLGLSMGMLTLVLGLPLQDDTMKLYRLDKAEQYFLLIFRHHRHNVNARFLANRTLVAVSQPYKI